MLRELLYPRSRRLDLTPKLFDIDARTSNSLWEFTAKAPADKLFLLRSPFRELTVGRGACGASDLLFSRLEQVGRIRAPHLSKNVANGR